MCSKYKQVEVYLRVSVLSITAFFVLEKKRKSKAHKMSPFLFKILAREIQFESTVGMKAVVIGGAGHLGKALVKALHARGIMRIVSLDCEKHEQPQHNVQTIQCNILDSAKLRAALEGRICFDCCRQRPHS